MLTREQTSLNFTHVPYTWASRKLTASERDYDVGNWELWGFKTLEVWQYWLEEAKFPSIITDKNLKCCQVSQDAETMSRQKGLFFTHFNFILTVMDQDSKTGLPGQKCILISKNKTKQKKQPKKSNEVNWTEPRLKSN